MRTLGVLTDRTTQAQKCFRCQSVDEWRLCWDYNKDAKAIIQSLTNVVPSHEQMGPGVWVGKQAGYPSPSWLDESRINGMQRHSRGSQHCMLLSTECKTLKSAPLFCTLLNLTNLNSSGWRYCWMMSCSTQVTASLNICVRQLVFVWNSKIPLLFHLNRACCQPWTEWGTSAWAV